LPAGTTLTVGERGVSGPTQYWNLNKLLLSTAGEDGSAPLSDEDRGLLIRRALRDSVGHHLTADVPVGIFLSAGRDASTVLALASEFSDTKVKTFTLGFSEYSGTADDEVPLATTVANEYGAAHTTALIKRDDFVGEFDNILSAMDQPSIDGINTYMVCREAHRCGLKVALTGIGGDELFGGYPSFRQVPALIRAVRQIPFARKLGGRLRRTIAPAMKYLTSPKYSGLIEYGLTYSSAFLLRRALFMPWEIGDILGPDVTKVGLEKLEVDRTLYHSIEGLKEPHSMMLALEMEWYMRDRLLRDADWASMAHSLEIRTPFVDHVVLEQLAPVIASKRPYTKFEMSVTPRHRLPDPVLVRRKTGFSIPVREWLSDVPGRESAERGLRGWARIVYSNQTGQRLH
jgi:asparagine synthase (glutamine-hydrolysing)